MSGIDLLRAVREHDLDVPVVLVTGSPSVDTAVRAVQYGALRYVQKPVEPQVLLDVVAYAIRIHDLARTKRDALRILGERGREASDLAGLDTVMSRALGSLRMAYQPIISMSSRSIFAYEALMRPQEPALPNPGAMLEAAERLGRVLDLGRRTRELAARSIEALPAGVSVFVNLHPQELTDETLYSTMAPLSRHARRVVLEITERATLEDLTDLSERTRALRNMGFRFAVDDLGTGYAGLSSFVQLNPEIVKVDMGLVRDIHRNEMKEKVIRSIQGLCQEMRIGVVAEGVEVAEERRVLSEIGVDLLQGYAFARPSDRFEPVSQDIFR
jgi:EAL domain-containing protein (putative c-di-GMP-specific phosphodiesterase class I)